MISCYQYLISKYFIITFVWLLSDIKYDVMFLWSVMGVMVRSDTDVLSQITRSISVPTGVESFQDDSILDITIKQRYWHRFSDTGLSLWVANAWKGQFVICISYFYIQNPLDFRNYKPDVSRGFHVFFLLLASFNSKELFQNASVKDPLYLIGYFILFLVQRKRKTHRRTPSSVLQDLVEGEGRDKPPHIILIEQLFSFIGSNPEKAVC